MTTGNRGVVYAGPGEVAVEKIAAARLVDPRGRTAEHGVIPKVVVDASKGREAFDSDAPKKFVLHPH